MPIAKSFALSVGQNKYLRRQMMAPRDERLDQELSRILKITERTVTARGFNPAATAYDPRWQPFSWRLQPLVVQDPFIPTYVSIDRVTLIYSN